MFEFDPLLEEGRGNRDCFVPLDVRSGKRSQWDLICPTLPHLPFPPREMRAHSGENSQLRLNAVSLRFAVIPRYLTNVDFEIHVFLSLMGAVFVPVCPRQHTWVVLH